MSFNNLPKELIIKIINYGNIYDVKKYLVLSNEFNIFAKESIRYNTFIIYKYGFKVKNIIKIYTNKLLDYFNS